MENNKQVYVSYTNFQKNKSYFYNIRETNIIFKLICNNMEITVLTFVAIIGENNWNFHKRVMVQIWSDSVFPGNKPC